MGQWVTLTAADGHNLSAFHVAPAGVRRGGLILIQGIFGVNPQIQRLAETFGEEGFEVLAPALFDRLQRGVALGYGPDQVLEGRRLRTALGWDLPLLDLEAARISLGGSPGVVGYCWGGSLAFLAAARLSVACAVSYYGGQIVEHRHEQVKAPLLMHFGDRDTLIPLEDVRAIIAAQPSAEVHLYQAGHGFSQDARADFEPKADREARARTVAFLSAHVVP